VGIEPQASNDAGNLFTGIGAPDADEQITMLLQRPDLWIERIVSTGQCSPPGFWYDQDTMEWVIVLCGAAELAFADEPVPRRLGPGDWLAIAPHRRHRVVWTDPDQQTIWLAVHVR
jgi:cupin 2 domain-containing protein